MIHQENMPLKAEKKATHTRVQMSLLVALIVGLCGCVYIYIHVCVSVSVCKQYYVCCVGNREYDMQ